MKTLKKVVSVLTASVFAIGLLVNFTGCSSEAPFQPQQQNQVESSQLAKFKPGVIVPDTTIIIKTDTSKVTIPIVPENSTNSRYGVGTE